MKIFLLTAAIWYVVGVASFIYWWTKEHDFELRDVKFALFAGLFGPVLFVLHLLVDYKDGLRTVLLRKRGSGKWEKHK